MSSGITIRRATGLDLCVAQSWLSNARLPSGDLTSAHMQNFVLALAGDDPVGMIGLEQFDNTGLLRSLVVEQSTRSTGIGKQLVDALETRATELGVSELWLLTIDADAYFARLGYAVVNRDDAPESIRGTAEFSTLCPGDAVLMRKNL